MTDQTAPTDLAAQLAELTRTVAALAARLDEDAARDADETTNGHVVITGTITAPFSVDAGDVFYQGITAEEAERRIEAATPEQRARTAQRYVDFSSVNVDYEVQTD